MIKLVAFDWNGTLLADTVACMIGDDAALISLGYKPIGIKKFRETFEVPLLNFYAKIGVDTKNIPKDKFKKSEDAFHKNYEKRAACARTRAGTRSLLDWLQKRNIPSVIFSNHIRDRIMEQLARLKIENYFQEVIANTNNHEIIFNRGKGERLKEYLKEKSIEPSEILIVGDTTEEIEIARELGGISIAIAHGYQSTPRLKAAKPDYLINSLQQIEKIIAEKNLL